MSPHVKEYALQHTELQDTQSTRHYKFTHKYICNKSCTNYSSYARTVVYPMKTKVVVLGCHYYSVTARLVSLFAIGCCRLVAEYVSPSIIFSLDVKTHLPLLPESAPDTKAQSPILTSTSLTDSRCSDRQWPPRALLTTTALAARS